MNKSAAMKSRIDHITSGDSDAWFSANHDWGLSRLALEERFENDVAATMLSDDHKKAWLSAMCDARRHYAIHELHDLTRMRHCVDPLAALQSIQLSDEEMAKCANAIAAFRQQICEHLRTWQKERIEVNWNSRLISKKTQEMPGERNPQLSKQLEDLQHRWQALSDQIQHDGDQFMPLIAEALDFWQKAIALDPENKLLTDKIEKTKTTISKGPPAKMNRID
jgi:hypothetical protein